MRSYFVAGVLLTACITRAQSTGSIRGTVTFEAGRSVAHDTTIHLTPLGKTARTDDAGNYRFDDLPPGRYEVVAHLHFFNDQRKVVQVSPGSAAQADFHLKLAPVRQEVTVTASGREESTLETFASVTSLSGQQLTTR